MRLALMSDIHSNIHAFDACLAHAQAQGVDRLAILGDLVGYGPSPAQVIERVMSLSTDGAIVLRGNHDDLALNPPATVIKNEDAGASWAHNQLSQAQRDFIAGLPFSERCECALLVHASAQDPRRWTYVVDARTAQNSLDAATQESGVTHVFGGHVHLQTLYYRGASGKLMPFTPSVGVPVPVPSTATGLPRLVRWGSRAMATSVPCTPFLIPRPARLPSTVWPTTTWPWPEPPVRPVCPNSLQPDWRLVDEIV